MQDKIWMIVHDQFGFWYSPPATSAQEAWRNAESWEQFIQGGICIVGWVDAQKLLGWRARKVSITYEPR